jgi:hypothetical protein
MVLRCSTLGWQFNCHPNNVFSNDQARCICQMEIDRHRYNSFDRITINFLACISSIV